MDSIVQHIQNLLFEHNCVVIPELGGFITELKAAEVHPITHRFTPPTKRIAFNAQLNVNDGLLANTIAREEGISMEEAYAVIRSFVSATKEELRNQGTVVLPEIGKLYYNLDYKLEFEPDTRVNYLEESFGLQELFFKPIDRNLVDMNSPHQRPVRPVVRKVITPTPDADKKIPTNVSVKKKESGLKMVLIIIPLLLLVGAGGLIVYTKNNNMDIASLSIFGGAGKPPETKAPIKEEATEAVVTEEPVEATSEEEVYTEPEEVSTEIGGGNTIFNSSKTEEDDENPAKQNLVDKQKGLSDKAQKEDIGSSTAQHGRYFVIVGSFISRENAYSLRNKVAKAGSSVTVIEPTPDNKFYKVAIDDFSSKEEAIRKKNELIQDFGSSVWVMMY